MTATTSLVSVAGLAADVGHELRTPLNALVGTTRLLLDTELDAEQRRFAGMLLAAGRELSTIIDDVVDSARIESGALELDEAPFSPVRLVKECVALFDEPSKHRRFGFVENVDPSVPATLVGDGPRLRRVLVHALETAVRSGARGEVPVHVFAARLPDARVELHVGVGRVATGAPRRTATPGGAASGDAGRSAFRRDVARALCRRMGGWLCADDSAEGVPRIDVAVVLRRATPADAPRAACGPSSAPRQPLRVLVVEDDPLNCSVAVRTLERLGFRPDTAANGREAVEAADRFDYDVLLTDLRMPGLSGFDVARTLRGRRAATRPCVIGMTAAATDADRDACRAAGMAALVTKPIDAADLAGALGRLPPARPERRMPAAKLLDPVVVDELRALGASVGDDGLVAKLIDLYVADAPSTIERLRSSVAAGDAGEFERSAHHLAGISAAVGAASIAALASGMEKTLRESGAAEALRRIADVDDAWPVTRDALVAARSTPSGDQLSTIPLRTA